MNAGLVRISSTKAKIYAGNIECEMAQAKVREAVPTTRSRRRPTLHRQTLRST